MDDDEGIADDRESNIRQVIRRTERWFVRQGVPNLVAGYGFRSHVLPRMARFLGPAALLVAAAAVGFVVIARPGVTGVLLTALVALTGFVAIVAVSALATAYGIVPLAFQATRHALADMRGSLRLQGRALPTLLFVTFFLFFTGELWQLMNHLAWGRLVLVLALFAAVTVLATSARLRGEVDRVEHDLNPDRLAHACVGTPLEGHSPSSVATPAALTGRQETNLLLVLATRQLVQAAVVGLGLFAFFVVLGAIVIDDTVAATWIGEVPHRSAVLPWLPSALLRAAALLAGFASMYFAITTMTQTEHRQQFFEPVIGDVERLLAVRAVYLDLRRRSRSGSAPAPR
jgi:hypothetical protein